MSKRNKRASVSYNIDVRAVNENNRINTITNFKIDTEKIIDVLSLETAEMAAKTVEACAESAEAAAKSTAILANKIMNQTTIDPRDEEIQRQKSVIVESIAEAAVATATAARIAAKISKLGGNTNTSDIENCIHENDENTEELIEKYNKRKSLNIETLDNQNKNNLNEMESKPRIARSNRSSGVSLSCSPAPNLSVFNELDPVERGQIKDFFITCFKKIKNSLTIMTKNGINMESLKDKFDLILEDIELTKSNSEILLHLIKDSFDDIYEQIKDNCALSVEFLYDVFEDIITNLSALRKRNVQQNELREKIYELLFSLPKQHTIYKIKDKLDDIQETIEDATHQTLVNLGIKRENNENSSELTDVTQTMNEAINNIETEIQNMKLNSLNTLELSFDKIKTEAINYIETFKNSAVNVILQQGIELKKQSDEIITLHNNEIDLIKQKADTTILEMNNSFKENEHQLISSMNNNINYLTTRMEQVDQVVKKIDECYENKVNSFNEELEEYKEEFQEYISEIGSEIQESRNTIKDEIEDMINETVKIATEKLMDVYEKGMSFKKEIETSNEKNKINIIEYIQKFIENCKQKLQEEVTKFSECKLLEFVKLFRDEEIKARSSLNIEQEFKDKTDEYVKKTKTEINKFGSDITMNIEKYKKDIETELKNNFDQIQNKLKEEIKKEYEKYLNEFRKELEELRNEFKRDLKKDIDKKQDDLYDKTKQLKDEMRVELKNEMYKIKEELKLINQEEIKKLQDQCINEVHKEVGIMLMEAMDICDDLYNRINSFSLSLSNYLTNQSINSENIKELQELLKSFNVNINDIKNTINQNKSQTTRTINRNFRKINDTIRRDMK